MDENNTQQPGGFPDLDLELDLDRHCMCTSICSQV